MIPTAHQQTVGIAWYDREQWETLHTVAADRNELDESFDAWEIQAIETACMLETRGFAVAKIMLHVPKLLAWCRKQGIPNTAAARSQYAAHLLRQRMPPSTLRC